MFTTTLLYFTLSCVAGTDCTQATAGSAKTYRTTLACEQAAIAAAQAAFYMRGERYNYSCKPIAFVPQRVAN